MFTKWNENISLYNMQINSKEKTQKKNPNSSFCLSFSFNLNRNLTLFSMNFYLEVYIKISTKENQILVSESRNGKRQCYRHLFTFITLWFEVCFFLPNIDIQFLEKLSELTQFTIQIPFHFRSCLRIYRQMCIWDE